MWKQLVRFFTHENKKYINRAHLPTKLTPIQASLRKNEEVFNINLSGKGLKIKPKLKNGDLVRTTDLKKMFSKSDTTNWSYKYSEITEDNFDKLPSYRIDYLPERHNQALVKKVELTLKENKDVMKDLNIN